MQFATVNGVTLHYQVISAADDKPTLVFANSLGTDFRIWRDVIVRLVGDFSIVLYDKRGHGLSETGETPYKIDDHVNDLAGLLDHLGVSQAIVCGLSVGGLIAQGLLYLRPDLVRAMVLCCTAAKIGDADSWNTRIKAVEDNGIEPMLDTIMSLWFTPDFHSQRANDLRGYRTMVQRQPMAGYLATCAALRDADLRPAATVIKIPTICISGDQDGSTPPDLVLETARMIPDCRYEMIKGAAHIPCVEQPEILVEIIRAFVKDAAIG
ncbi:MAG: 3-oxoadipate enol-lactonase [Ahrensia sp.]|nr:3-oxoadipate enol-lactonase [Ahrensia sp.]